MCVVCTHHTPPKYIKWFQPLKTTFFRVETRYLTSRDKESIFSLLKNLFSGSINIKA